LKAEKAKRTVSGAPKQGGVMADLFFSRDRVFALGPRRGAYFATFVLLFILTELGRHVYRPFIYQNSINDFGFADVIGNLLGTIVIIFFQLALNHATRVQGFRIIVFATVGITIYELMQAILPRGVLDWKDVICTPIAGVVSLGLFLLILKFIPDSLPKSGEANA
jgi:hypothetical protein